MCYRHVGQLRVELSNPEAEYYRCCEVAAELLYLQAMLSDMGYSVDLEAHTDASGAKALASRQGLGRVLHGRCETDEDSEDQGRPRLCRHWHRDMSRDVLASCNDLVCLRDWSPRQFPLEAEDDSE